MTAPGLRRWVSLMAGLAAMLLSGAAVAQGMRVERCVLEIPRGWSVTGSSARSPDGVVTIQIREVSRGQVFVRFQRAFGVRTSPIRGPDLTVMFAEVGSTTRYYAVAPALSERACTAQITSYRAARNEEAFAIAGTLRRLPR